MAKSSVAGFVGSTCLSRTGADRQTGTLPHSCGVVPAETSTSPHWHGLLDAEDETAFASAWLALQCSRIAGVAAGLLLIRQRDAGAPRLSVTWPARDLDFGDLLRLAETAYAERRMVVAPGRVGPDASPAQPVALIVAVPLGTAQEPIAAAAIALTTTAGKPASRPQSSPNSCAGARAGSRHCPGRGALKELSSDIARAASCLDLLAAIGAQPRLHGMAISAHQRACNPSALRSRVDGHRQAKRHGSPARGVAFRQLQEREPSGRRDRECDGGGDRAAPLRRLSAAACDGTRRDASPIRCWRRMRKRLARRRCPLCWPAVGEN